MRTGDVKGATEVPQFLVSVEAIFERGRTWIFLQWGDRVETGLDFRGD
jgi:hypothetical protein